MCGIAGIVWSSPQADATRMIERMTQALQHRGPDGSGAWTGEGCVLGHRRLSVIDLAGGSFRWWGAWLANRPGKRVFAPTKWIQDVSMNTSDVCPPEWIRL